VSNVINNIDINNNEINLIDFNKSCSGRLTNLTIMLLEACNLDCWMCDYAKSKGLKKKIPLIPDEIVDLLSHPFFGKLESVTFTGGEPFAYPGLEDLYVSILNNIPNLIVNFSTNATLLKKMTRVFDHVKDWSKVNVFVSVDGIETHDEQRGVEGCFEETTKNIDELRKLYPGISITLKLTITKINHQEIEDAHDYFVDKGYSFTAKFVENNPYYTNKLNNDRNDDFSFNDDQYRIIFKQIDSIIKKDKQENKRINELKELHDAMCISGWKRPDRCLTPKQGAFIDSDLNFFSCKEYPPVANLSKVSLSDLTSMPEYLDIVKHEKNNSAKCTHCLSQMKMPARGGLWFNLLNSFSN